MSVPPVTPLVTWPATPDDVAALLRARTQDNTDVEVGQWTTGTRPTLVEVERILAMAQANVLGKTGSLDELVCATADDILTQAAFLVALLAAMLVELSYFPEQVNSDRSAYTHYKDLWDTAVVDLVEAVAECAAGGVEPSPESGGVAGPSWAFPVDCGGMVGWQTRW